jgi:hypothetical protein
MLIETLARKLLELQQELIDELDDQFDVAIVGNAVHVKHPYFKLPYRVKLNAGGMFVITGNKIPTYKAATVAKVLDFLKVKLRMRPIVDKLIELGATTEPPLGGCQTYNVPPNEEGWEFDVQLWDDGGFRVSSKNDKLKIRKGVPTTFTNLTGMLAAMKHEMVKPTPGHRDIVGHGAIYVHADENGDLSSKRF